MWDNFKNCFSPAIGPLILLVILIAFFLLMGCTSQKEMYAEARECGGGPECRELWERLDRYEDRMTKREAERARSKACNDNGGVLWCEVRIGGKVCACLSRAQHQERISTFF